MCPRPVVVVDVLRQDLSKMPFADHDDVVQAFPANRADHPLGIRVLPRRAGRPPGYPTSGPDAKIVLHRLGLGPESDTGAHPPSAHASSSWRAVHSAVGCAVTLKC